ncbi:SH3 domain-containing protein [Oscillatoriales cyanobacterium LEGE 11467]|uniref:SH3 domain-containing protein n=1 Tax=Zarconia navalis LEGE 11467 TaxID=1828826 RepID=A0A928Z6Y8_9CYAN|nr:SH3 domain-containing protein [Zarconia navalis]MBE9040897.1 SH3 domain-containing protein [Zarconia navalis LEGE 11467]
MKFHLPIAELSLALLLTPAFAPASVQAQPAAREAVVCPGISALNLREIPDGRILDALPPGTSVLQVAPPAGDWQPIATEDYRGYVWGAYLCDDVAQTEPEPEDDGDKTPDKDAVGPMVTPARCGRNDENLRNVSYSGGLEIYARPDSASPILGFIGDGGVVRLNGVSFVGGTGVIWQPINFPERGYIEGGRDGVVSNLVYCTRFYE